MKNQVLFSLKDKSKKIKMSDATIFVWRFKRYVFGFGKGVIICFTGKYVKNCSGFGDLAEVTLLV